MKAAAMGAILALTALAPLPTAQQTSPAGSRRDDPELDCAYRSPGAWMEALRKAVERGEIPDPSTKLTPGLRQTTPRSKSTPMPPVDTSDIHPFEDSSGVLLTNFSDGQLLNLMADAANDLMATHGDIFDFVGYWVNFTPDHTIGTAFYMPIFNDVSGLGDPSTEGTPIFDNRASLGVNGNTIQGYVMMWNINSSFWQPGTGSNASFTRLVLGQEFEHRWALFLPDLLDGRRLQGNNGNCGRIFHWNFHVDGQGSGMEIAEWVGGAPRSGMSGSLPWTSTGEATRANGILRFNTDIGGVFSYTDLYLMGYVSPAEMDAGNSELRYMDRSNCSGTYLGPMSTFTSADIVASAGPRTPDSTTSKKDWRTGWVMIHQPGDAPSIAELTKAAGIQDQHQNDWFTGTLSRGTMDATLP